MGFEEKEVDEEEEKLSRQLCEVSLHGTETNEHEEEEEEGEEENQDHKDGESFKLGPQYSLKEQLEKDKEDESLRRWKEQLLGNVDLESVGETLEAEVKIESVSILSPGRPDLVLPLPMLPNSKRGSSWFTLKEGSRYRLKLAFMVSNNIVSGLTYTNTVWKTGVKVDSTKLMMGAFGPHQQPYTLEMAEEITPSGIFARGSYSARTRIIDDDNKCYLELNYTFDIRKEWAEPS
ncbi:hypothetical protein AMTR_s00055p00186940 [Amborella trichopoda]|uniref:Rho GDP-dissociation inhibitor 1 n=2 Tax=Amborella trichopoda TaxID=13333 RepID=U5D7V1_AMBTC|nr:hypothetical protein AMTR_s00055p00186940 [Amborella trichopoda]